MGILAALLLSHVSPAAVCRNLARVESQYFPEKIELSWGKKRESELSVHVLKTGEDNLAVTTDGHSYAASRLVKKEEARYRVPTYYVNDNPEFDYFADDERDTATLLFVEPAVYEGKAGKVKLWLHYHYNGDGKRGVQGNKYECAAESR